MSQIPSSVGNVPLSESSGTPAAGDPLSHLHKMSTTAGLGSGDYVSINSPAVAAVIIGVASSLAMLDNVLLFVPVVGLVIGIISLYQIGRSNGTQSGRAFAIGGMLLSLAFGGYVLGSQYMEHRRAKADEDAVGAVTAAFGKALHDHDWAAAYAQLSPAYQQRITLAAFTDRLKPYTTSPIYGNIGGAVWNGRLQTYVETATNTPLAASMAIITFDKQGAGELREDVVYRKTAEGWKIDNMPSMF